MLKLLIARHGNTFDAGDEILRVGVKTDLPLSNSGIEQAKQLRNYLSEHYPQIHAVYCSELKRTQQTASIAASKTYAIESALNEFDYGIDEGAPEKQVIERLGKKALSDWDTYARLPNGWNINLLEHEMALKQFIDKIMSSYDENMHDTTILIVTSNGIARLFPKIFSLNSKALENIKTLKIKTGYICSFHYHLPTGWALDYWNKQP